MKLAEIEGRLPASQTIQGDAGGQPGINRKEALDLTRLRGQEVFEILERANRLRSRSFGNEVSLLSLYSIQTGICPEDCAFCAQSTSRRAATGLEIRQFSGADPMLVRARAAEEAGASEICLVASGTRLSNPRRLQELAQGIRSIKSHTRLACGVNIGLMHEDDLALLKDAGADTLIHNLETAASYHPRIISSHTYADEVETIRVGQRVGMKIQTGGILGMGETWEQRVELAFDIRELAPDTVALSLFQPMPGTPLAHLPIIDPLEALHCLALFRCVFPETPLYLLGGREKVLRELEAFLFYSGVNGTTVGDYLFTRGRQASSLTALIHLLGLRVHRP